MEEQILHWIPLTLALVAAIIILYLSRPVRRERRSCGQRIIFMLYRFTRWAWAVARAADTGYLEYCQVIGNTRFEIENEKVFGHRIKPASVNETGSPETLSWETAQKSA